MEERSGHTEQSNRRQHRCPTDLNVQLEAMNNSKDGEIKTGVGVNSGIASAADEAVETGNEVTSTSKDASTKTADGTLDTSSDPTCTQDIRSTVVNTVLGKDLLDEQNEPDQVNSRLLFW
ncbi:hypothetical protein BGX24_011434 [Mortierella sp. AD032]|nr:hypothetical protein BGX24_011434 [Mortierella sp. AD032]